VRNQRRARSPRVERTSAFTMALSIEETVSKRQRPVMMRMTEAISMLLGGDFVPGDGIIGGFPGPPGVPREISAWRRLTMRGLRGSRGWRRRGRRRGRRTGR